MRILVTGGGGFLGRALLGVLGTGHEVASVDVAGVGPVAGIAWTTAGGPDGLARAVGGHRPDLVVHAAFVNRLPPGQSELEYLQDALTTNMLLFRACAAVGARLLLVSSSAVYGRAAGSGPVDEGCPRAPVSLYGVAKVTQEMLAEHCAADSGLPLSIARLFNLCGPGQGPGMLLPDWVSRVVAIGRGAEPVLRVRTLATSRDFVDVRDAARALERMIDHFTPGAIMNVASGREVPLVEIHAELARRCPVAFTVVESAPRPGATEVLRQRGSAARLTAATGWRPEIDFWQSLDDVWREWGDRASGGS